ncbi:MAG: hypothetical protein A2107_07045 [Verrucomicrobia bacterium GWF2_62_7]|nr:MAG: hypothetical protein A2107_07045 [Verrucomicrobia bacterium GWF2_62_7]
MPKRAGFAQNARVRPIILAVILAATAAVFAQSPVMEKQLLFGGASAKGCSPAESTVEVSTARVKVGSTALHWHVTVDYYAGEKKYPIGWPRFGRAIPEGPQRDWSAWDYLHAWIYTDTTRAALPKEAVGLGIQAPDKATTFHRPLAELKKGEWVEITVPVSALPQPGDVRNIQFHIAESNYKHADHLDLFVDDLALLRYAQPTILDFAAEAAVMFTGARVLPVKLKLAGIQPGQRTELTCELRRDGQTVAQATASAERGPQRIALDPGNKKLPPGDYELAARVAGNPQPVTAKVRLVESPWRK